MCVCVRVCGCVFNPIYVGSGWLSYFGCFQWVVKPPTSMKSPAISKLGMDLGSIWRWKPRSFEVIYLLAKVNGSSFSNGVSNIPETHLWLVVSWRKSVHEGKEGPAAHMKWCNASSPGKALLGVTTSAMRIDRYARIYTNIDIIDYRSIICSEHLPQNGIRKDQTAMLWGSPSRIFPTPGDATPKRATVFRSGRLEAEGLPVYQSLAILVGSKLDHTQT